MSIVIPDLVLAQYVPNISNVEIPVALISNHYRILFTAGGVLYDAEKVCAYIAIITLIVNRIGLY